MPRDNEKKTKLHTRIRAAVERPFAHIKQHMKYRTTRYIGIHKNRLHHTLIAIAYNLWHVPKILRSTG